MTGDNGKDHFRGVAKMVFFFYGLMYLPCAMFSSLPSSHHLRMVLSMDLGLSPIWVARSA